MLERTLEPELMDDPQESQSYDEMDHSTVNQQFVSDLLACSPSLMRPGTRVLDLGTGTAQIPIELARRNPQCLIIASDAADSMLTVAEANIAAATLSFRISLHCCDSKQLKFPDRSFDCVMSNSLIHHLADPLPAMEHMVRVLRPTGLLFVRDLMRPSSAEEVEALVAEYAGEETPFNQQLLRQSLHAALTLEEIRHLASLVGIDADSVTATSDRHWTLCARR